jgi:hypothetical protein
VINLGLSPEARMCSQKVAFRECDAERRARELGYGFYLCPTCGLYHLTARGALWNKQTKSRRRKAQQRQYRRRRR